MSVSSTGQGQIMLLSVYDFLYSANPKIRLSNILNEKYPLGFELTSKPFLAANPASYSGFLARVYPALGAPVLMANSDLLACVFVLLFQQYFKPALVLISSGRLRYHDIEFILPDDESSSIFVPSRSYSSGLSQKGVSTFLINVEEKRKSEKFHKNSYYTHNIIFSFISF